MLLAKNVLENYFLLCSFVKRFILNMENSPGLMGMINELKKRCSRADQKLMADLKISQSELLFFSALDNCQGISSPELAKNMGLSLSRISRVVDKLVVNGYLDRKNDDADRRAIRLCLTVKGKSVRTKIEKVRNECEDRLMEAIPQAEMERFEHLFSEILQKI